MSCGQSVEKQKQVLNDGQDSFKISAHKDDVKDSTTFLTGDGDIYAQLNSAEKYVYGRGAEQNFQIAMEILRDLVEIGIPEAEFLMGECCRLQGDYISAKDWYESSGRKGNATALNNLGNCYLKGLGVPVDTIKAFDCYKNAEMLGSVLGQSNVGIIYANGFGVEQDSDEAVRWLKMAASQNGKSTIKDAAIKALQEYYGIYWEDNE